MIDETTGAGKQWMKAPVLAGISGGMFLTLILCLSNWGWHGLMGYNGSLFGIYAYSYLALMLLGFLFTGALSVFLTAEHGVTRRKVLSSGIVSGIIAGIVFSSLYLYTDIFLNPLNYPPFPGDFLKIWTFFQGIERGLFILMGLAILAGMIVATIGALASGFLHQRYGKPDGSGADGVKTGKIHRIILIALFAIIVAILIIPPVIVAIGIDQGAIAREPFGPVSFGSAGLTVPPDQPIGDDHASNVTRWMQQHAGQEVSAGEYLEITNPGSLDTFSLERKEAYYAMKVRVPDLINPDEGMQFGKRSVAIATFGYREIPGEQQPAYAGNYTRQCILNESMIVVSNGLEGKEISIGTYLESVCPEYLAGLSGSHKAALYNMTIPVSKIPVDSKTAVFVPPLYAAKTEFTFNPAKVSLLYQ